MSAEFDLVIRGGLIVDGSGSAPFEGDVGLKGDRIAAIGSSLPEGKEEIDAKGLLVTPGFVDPHTHYDGHVTWGSRLEPSSAHGITTAVIGNCGVGFAPCRPDMREDMIRLMEGVEDIPHAVLAAGIPWEWESFPEYLDFLSGRTYDMDVAAYVPHAPLRVFVMGERAIKLEQASADDIDAMSLLLREAMDAGALGIATSRTIFHRSSDGTSIPTLAASEGELVALVDTLNQSVTGMLQYVGGGAPETRKAVFELARRIAESTGRPVTFSSVESNEPPFFGEELVELLRDANANGLHMRAQVMPRGIGIILGHELTLNPFYSTPTYLKLNELSFEEKVKELRKKEVRAQILSETPPADPTNALGAVVRQFKTMFIFGDPPEYEQPPEASIAARAARQGVSPEELAYDLMLELDGHQTLYLAMSNLPSGNLDRVRALLKDPNVIPGLGDGGAHCATICDGSYSTFMLIQYVRDRSEAQGGMSLPMAISKLTRAPAETVGLLDRGLLKPGYKADINVIDLKNLKLHAPRVSYDFPGGGKRLLQDTEGYFSTIVSGIEVRRAGRPTGALPGRLVRGGQSF